MQRSFTFTGAADTAFHNLYSKILTLSGAVPADSILPDRVCELTVQLEDPIVVAGNGGQYIIISDNNTQGGLSIMAGGSQTYRTNGNNICLRDFSYKQSTGGLTINISFSSK